MSLSMPYIIIIVIVGVILLVTRFSKRSETTPPQTNPFTASKPVDDVNDPFSMTIEDVFTITGRGTVVTGRVESGMVKLHDTVKIIGLNNNLVTTTTVTGIEMFRKHLDYAQAGDNAGILLDGVTREMVERGQKLTK